MNSFKDLEIWQKSIDLSVNIYQLTKSFPSEEKYGLISQLRRAAVSIPSNIAEGWGRNNKKEFIHFLNIAKSSCMELETQLIIALRLNHLNNDCFNQLRSTQESIMMMSNKLISRLKNKS